MNIFFVDEDPATAAKYLVDRHVVKMILESAQLLSTAHRVLDGKDYILADAREPLLYKVTHINHPCAIWTRTSIENYNWLVDHFFGLMGEYTYRYGKVHKCYGELSYALASPPYKLEDFDFTPPPCAMPDEYKVSMNYVDNYRNYYNIGKRHLHNWKNREKPDWIG